MSFRSDTETGYKHTTADNSMKKNKLKDSGDPHDYSKAHHPASKPSAQKDSLPVTFAFQNPIQYKKQQTVHHEIFQKQQINIQFVVHIPPSFSFVCMTHYMPAPKQKFVGH